MQRSLNYAQDFLKKKTSNKNDLQKNMHQNDLQLCTTYMHIYITYMHNIYAKQKLYKTKKISLKNYKYVIKTNQVYNEHHGFIQ